MDKKELRDFISNVDYTKCTLQLQDKYELAPRAYFANNSCLSVPKNIRRGNEGLFIHHIQEIVIDDLSKPEKALAAPWEYQEPQNLCYCNYLEHLWLHILINKARCDQNGCFVSDGVLHHLVPEINTVFNNDAEYTTPQTKWRNVAKSLIINNEEEYKLMLTQWLSMIKEYNCFWWLTLPNLLDGTASAYGQLYSSLIGGV